MSLTVGITVITIFFHLYQEFLQ